MAKSFSKEDEERMMVCVGEKQGQNISFRHAEMSCDSSKFNRRFPEVE